MVTNRGGGAKRSSANAPAAPAPVAVVAPLAQPPQSDETIRNNRERMRLEREADFKRSEHSLRNRIHDSGYVWFDIPSQNETYVGHISDFTESMKRHKATHISLRRRAAVKGTKVVVKGGETIFFLNEDHPDWSSVVNPETGEALIPAKADPERTKARREQEGLDPEGGERKMTELERINQPGFDRKKENRQASKKSSSKKASKAASKASAAKAAISEATEKHGDGTLEGGGPTSGG